MAEHELHFEETRSIGFIDGYVPYVTVEEFRPHKHTQEHDIVARTIKNVQVRRKREKLEEQYNLEIDPGGNDDDSN